MWPNLSRCGGSIEEEEEEEKKKKYFAVRTEKKIDSTF
jgi:hypothetical protein